MNDAEQIRELLAPIIANSKFRIKVTFIPKYRAYAVRITSKGEIPGSTLDQILNALQTAGYSTLIVPASTPLMRSIIVIAQRPYWRMRGR
jgi:hypothetical protein